MTEQSIAPQNSKINHLDTEGDFNPAIACSLNTHWHGKPSKEDHALGEYKWQRKTVTVRQVMDAVAQGRAFTSALGDAIHVSPSGKSRGIHRDESNFASLQLAGVDFDAGTDFEDVLDYPLARNSGAFLYATFSHTPEAPRCRIVFALEHPITEPERATALYRALIHHFDGEQPDESTHDCVRVWYGTRPGNRTTWIGEMLADSQVDALIAEYQATGGHVATARTAGPPDSAAVARSVAYALRVLDERGLEHGKPEAYKGGARIRLPKCPINPADNPHEEDGRFVVIVWSDGQITGDCKHDTCHNLIDAAGGNVWAMIKALPVVGIHIPISNGNDKSEPPPMDWAPEFTTEPPAGKAKVQPKAGGLAAFATHDSGNAAAFRALHADRFLWNDAYGWLSWEGTHWVHGAEAEALARTAAERMLLQRTTELAGTNAAAGVSPTAARIRNVLTLAQAHVFVRAESFDGTTNKHLLNTVSGVVDLRTGIMREARPGDRFLWVVPTPYDPQSTVEDEQWRALVLDWVSGKDDMAAFLQLAMGYSVTGESREKCLFFLHGAEGNNGKTTFTRAVTDALDCSITRGISLDAFTVASRMADPQGFGLAPLVHARYVPASEGDLKGALKGNVLKAITSHGDPMQVAEKGKQPIEWRPTIKLWPMSNHPPKVAGDDPVGWKRFRVIPFDRVYDGTHADPTLSERLREPAMRKAILRWLVQGAALWYAHGLPQPAAVTKATREAALANDSAARFAEECLKVDENAHVPASELHTAYLAWCEDEGIEERDRKNKVHLARALGRAGYTQDGSRLWKVGSAGKNA